MQRDLLDVESVAGHLLPAGSVFALLAEHRHQLFPAEMFTDLFPSGRGRPSIPPEVVASVLVLQTLPGLSDREAADAVVKPTPVPTHRSDRPRQVTVHVAGKGADAQEQPHELMVVGGGP